jgi:hypothetical protein
MFMDPTLPITLRFTPMDNTYRLTQEGSAELTLEDLQVLKHQYPVVIGAGDQSSPVVLIEPTDMELPLGGYLPEPVQLYPFSLVEPPALYLDDGMLLMDHPVILVECTAPHWFGHCGYRLWDDGGQFTPFMRQIRDRLQSLHHSMTRTRTLVQVLEQAGVLRLINLYHNGVLQCVYTVDPVALEQQYEWFDQHDQGLSAIMLADALLVSQAQLVELDGTWTTRSAYEQWVQPPCPGDYVRPC